MSGLMGPNCIQKTYIEIKMPKCYQLVGVPASGKSTWANAQDWVIACRYVSTDKWIETFAQEQGKTYSEVFDEHMPKAVKLMMKEVEVAKSLGKDIIWDQTSTTVASRKRKFNVLPDYEHIAVVFKTPERDELTRRLLSRPGKTIPDQVMRGMIRNFQQPSMEEGFKDIWHAI